jgi:hypothetical protein
LWHPGCFVAERRRSPRRCRSGLPSRLDGNDQLRLKQRSAGEEILHLMDDSPGGAREYIFTARGVLGGTSRTFEVPVDGSVSQLLVSVEHDRDLEATLFRPGGRAVTKADRDVRIGGVRQADIRRTSVSAKTLFTIL